jgi:hypothetical protein
MKGAKLVKLKYGTGPFVLSLNKEAGILKSKSIDFFSQRNK